MDTLSYAQHIAGNYLRNLAPPPENQPIDEAFLQDCTMERMQGGLIALYRLMMGIYWGMAQSPQDFTLPAHPDVLPRSGSKYGAAVRSVENVMRLLFTLGLYGIPLEQGQQVLLSVDTARLNDFCSSAKINNSERILSGLARHGLEIVFGNGSGADLHIRFPSAPDTALALAAFSRAACDCGKDDLHPPLEFYRADLRLLMQKPGKKPSFPIMLSDAANTLDEEQAIILASFDRLVETLGFRGEFKCSGLARGEWRGVYRSSRLGRTLFGFVVEEGQLGVRIMIDQTRRILPYLGNCPADFRELFYGSCACQSCGQCQDGPLQMELDGAWRKLCGYAYFAIPSFQARHVEAMRMLLETQARMLKEKAQPTGSCPVP